MDKISWYWLLDNPGNVITLFENEDRMDWYLFNLGEKENHNNFFRNTHNNYTPSFRRVSTFDDISLSLGPREFFELIN